MIQANELRIGSLVAMGVKMCRVNSIHTVYGINEVHYRMQGFIDSDPQYCVYDYQVDPIPLTPEILWKIGWIKGEKKSPYEYWYPSTNAMWSIRQEGNGKWQLCIIVREDEVWKFDPIIDSVHQLQNLYFALTGQELTINL